MSSVATSPFDGLNVKVTQARVVVSEWTKLRTVRSTLWSLGVAILLTAGLPLLVALIRTSRAHPDNHGPSALEVSSVGVNVSQLAIAVLGVLLITGEYSTGMIRASLTAVPTRLPVLWAKLGVYAVVSFLLMLPCVVIAFFGSQAILARKDMLQISFSHAGVARSVIGGAVYLMLIGVFALAIGAIVRSTAGGISAFAAIFFVIPPLLNILPTNWNNSIAPWLPDSSARAIFQLTHGSHSLSPGAGLLLFCGYVAATVAVAALLLVRRDA
jgi:ABC-2 type transport system permease protein